ncbi:putative DNA-binding domain-containing protein [Acinetobacter johnsonii]|uniref:HvfC family RiPP maturation protein n=1 Tax=Acinetobacter johnsonii TaxID=40214 RepID=UPI002FD9461C|nr:putative DNA-binding domain-containing protein [Acinetobacter johnsonii]
MNNKFHSFQDTQNAFCNWIRDPKQPIPSSFETERMRVYRELLFNNVSSFVDLVYPVARSILPKPTWQQLLEEFFQKSTNQSPFYNDISLQFREYLSDQQHPVLQSYPWLAELLQYEWLELYLDTVEIEEKTFSPASAWQLNTHIWILVYQYPVYLWTTEQQYFEHSPSAVMVWRNHHDQVCVEPLSPLFACLIEQLNLKALTEQELKQLIYTTVPDLSEQEVEQQLKLLSERFTELDLLYIPEQ